MKSHSKSRVTVERDKQAKIRAYARSTRTDREQLQFLEERGHGHCQEAERLREKINAPRPKKVRGARARRP